MIILTMFAVLLLLLSINVPIAIGLAVTTIIAMVLKTGTSFLIDTAIVMFDGSMKFPLIAIPLFILSETLRIPEDYKNLVLQTTGDEQTGDI